MIRILTLTNYMYTGCPVMEIWQYDDHRAFFNDTPHPLTHPKTKKKKKNSNGSLQTRWCLCSNLALTVCIKLEGFHNMF